MRASATDSPQVRVEASILLAEVLAGLRGVGSPIVQFMPACLAGADGHVSREFAVVAAARFGRTLLIDTTKTVDTPSKEPTCRGGNRKPRRAPTMVPDSDVPGLYHRRASEVSFETIITETPADQPFRMMIVQSLTPSVCPSSLDHARHCHGTILTVAAGVTRLPELQTTARQLRLAGGTLLGVVLFDACHSAAVLPANVCRLQ